MVRTKNLYAFPFMKKDLIKAISNPVVHFAHFRHAIDFILPEGSQVLASKGGTVVDIKVDSREGGSNPKYNNLKYVNYLTLKHSNAEYSQYLHLKYKGSLVKLGEKVKMKQPIALSGNTGLTTRPHLHFQVFKLNRTKIGWETIKVRFREKISVDRTQRPLPSGLKKAINAKKN